MIQRVIFAVVAVLAAFTISANQLDDQFEAIGRIEGASVQDVPQSELVKAGMRSAKIIAFGEKVQAEATDSILNTIGNELKLMDVTNGVFGVVGWAVESSEDDVTMLLSVSFPVEKHTAPMFKGLSTDVNVSRIVVICKGPKSMLEKIIVD